MHSFLPVLWLNSWEDVLKANPSLLGVEILTTLLCLWGIIVAFREKDRWHRVLVSAALFGGASIELLTIMEPQIGNFYHSQATVMLFGLREPFWMLLYYIYFQYVSVALAWKLNLSPMAEAGLATLLGSFLHQVLDQVGVALLWWNWHNGEPNYEDRRMGVPIASTFWVASTLWSLAIVLRWAKSCKLKPRMLYGVLLGPLAALVLMNLPFWVFFHPMATFYKLHASLALWAFRGFCISFMLGGLRQVAMPRLSAHFVILSVFLLYLIGAAVFTPYTQIVRTSFGQPLGESSVDCAGVMEQSFWGLFERTKYVCPGLTQATRDHYDFHCVAQPKPTAAPGGVMGLADSWYTVCGVNALKENFWLVDVVMCSLGAWLLAVLASSPPVEAQAQTENVEELDKKKK